MANLRDRFEADLAGGPRVRGYRVDRGAYESPDPGGVDAEGRPLDDVDQNCTVDLVDHAITTRNFSGP